MVRSPLLQTTALISSWLIASAKAQDNCQMQIWVFDSLDRCNAINPPNANGTIYADNTCRTVETDTEDPASADYALLPGTYRAECTAEGKIRFYESGCITDNCASTSLVMIENPICDRDLSKTAALFSRLSPPECDVQGPTNTTNSGFYTCFRLMGSDNSVTFVIFGDCSDPGCSVEGVINPIHDADPRDAPSPKHCEMKIEVYESYEACGTSPPAETGTIYGDGECHTIETSASGEVYDWFPGNYRATCDSSGSILFLESGCVSDTCSSTEATEVCYPDSSIPSFIYARLEKPFRVSESSTEGRICNQGSYTNSNGEQIFINFAIYGECNSQCASEDDTPNSTTEEAPVVAPRTEPIEPPISPTDPLTGGQEENVMRQQHKFEGITIAFVGVEELSLDDFFALEEISNDWYENFFEKRQAVFNSSVGVLDMRTSFSVQSQDPIPANGTMIAMNTITYDQAITFTALDVALTADEYILLPFWSLQDNVEYGARLAENIGAFRNVETPIAIPKLPVSSSPDDEEIGIVQQSGDEGLSTGASIGVFIVVVVVAHMIG